MPLFHIGGQAVMFEIVQATATNVLVTQFDAGVQLELVEAERATHTVGVPTMLQDVVEHPTFGRRDLSALRTVSTGGSLVPVEPDGWVQTGDLVTMDERGYLCVTGRVKDMIVTGGANVYPAEVEAVIAAHPAVVDVAVISLPDDRWGEAVVAVVRVAVGVTAD